MVLAPPSWWTAAGGEPEYWKEEEEQLCWQPFAAGYQQLQSGFLAGERLSPEEPYKPGSQVPESESHAQIRFALRQTAARSDLPLHLMNHHDRHHQQPVVGMRPPGLLPSHHQEVHLSSTAVERSCPFLLALNLMLALQPRHHWLQC
jgi:hypothetical protein